MKAIASVKEVIVIETPALPIARAMRSWRGDHQGTISACMWVMTRVVTVTGMRPQVLVRFRMRVRCRIRVRFRVRVRDQG